MTEDQNNNSVNGPNSNLGSVEEGQQRESSSEGHARSSDSANGPLETNTGVGGSSPNVGAGSEVEGGAGNGNSDNVVRPKNSEALGGLGSGYGSTPDTGTNDRGSGSQGGSSAAGGPAEGLGGRRTADNGNSGASSGADMEEGNDHGGGTSGESGADMGTGSGGSTGETIGTP